MSARDDAHEALIKAAFQNLMDAACRESKLAAFEEMKELIAQRSPESIERMEREQNLRA
jgi:hypothetical protein